MAPRYTTAKDGGSAIFAGAKNCTVHPEHTRSLPSMAPRYTVHPEHNNQHTFTRCWFFYHSISQLFILLNQASCF